MESSACTFVCYLSLPLKVVASRRERRGQSTLRDAPSHLIASDQKEAAAFAADSCCSERLPSGVDCILRESFHKRPFLMGTLCRFERTWTRLSRSWSAAAFEHLPLIVWIGEQNFVHILIERLGALDVSWAFVW
ncbi:hypothetical protein BDZ89DRAFT_1111344 [Hymenopellis radicata]|nr:hypothetical protein BDZ89DRAFT_1111344 [Hymenopellis radicata]